MTISATDSAPRAGARGSLAARIALVLVIKALGLAVLWFLFVRDQRVTVDAHSTASAFGLAGAAPGSKVQMEGNVHGQ